MLGVVLWSDCNDNKAVIWCEDHGNLAFFNGSEQARNSVIDFDAGDLVQFELEEERHMRLAQNPKRISEAFCPDIGQDLQAMALQEHTPKQTAPCRDAFKSADILPFGPRQNPVSNAEKLCELA
jgi:hypothetical protein